MGTGSAGRSRARQCHRCLDSFAADHDRRGHRQRRKSRQRNEHEPVRDRVTEPETAADDLAAIVDVVRDRQVPRRTDQAVQVDRRRVVPEDGAHSRLCADGAVDRNVPAGKTAREELEERSPTGPKNGRSRADAERGQRLAAIAMEANV